MGRQALDMYFNLANYRNNWKRLGFTDDEVSRPGSDRLVDAVVAYGTPDAIAARLNEHLLAAPTMSLFRSSPKMTTWCRR